jgi:S1-C subfamily serine protease
LFCTGLQAKTASEVFALASHSVVVVMADKAIQLKTQGSGVALSGQRVATNCHVVERAVWIVVHDSGGKSLPARLLHTDEDRDVCILGVSGLKAAPALLGNSASLRIGDPIYAIGTPRGLDLILSEGIISSFRGQGTDKLIQITAPISPGSSGGGLFDAEGQLIGLPTFMLRESQQLNFAVPVEWVKAALSPVPSVLNRAPVQPSYPYTASLKPMPAAPQPTAPEPSNSPKTPGDMAKQLYRKSDWTGLLQHAENWTATNPEDPMAVYSLGVAYFYTDQRGLTTDIYSRLKGLDAKMAEEFFQRYVIP